MIQVIYKHTMKGAILDQQLKRKKGEKTNEQLVTDVTVDDNLQLPQDKGRP